MPRSDDPREVLALLNSLGFIGITAPQLKAFMKDLKMYRKVKEREKQQWKEEIKKKILSKQVRVFKEISQELQTERSPSTSGSTTSNSLYREESLINVKIECTPENKENVCLFESDEIGDKLSIEKMQKPQRISRPCRKDVYDGLREEKSGDLQKKHVSSKADRERPASAPERPRQTRRSRSVESEPLCTARSSSKSFIRPWRLHPENKVTNKKSDPVALYQKYQNEWKQLALPGEERHANVRWAVREKMLGADPNPRPLLPRSQSAAALRKR